MSSSSTLSRALLALVLAVGFGSCGATGLLYTEVTRPLDLDLSSTAAQPSTGESDWKTFSYGVQVDWDSSAIADAARSAGLTEIHFADLKVVSVLFGVWVKRTAIVYGRGPK